MGLRSFFGKVLNKLAGHLRPAPPKVARIVPVAQVVREAIPVATFAPPFAKRVFPEDAKNRMAREKAKIPGRVPVARIVPEARVGKVVKPLKRQEVGGRAKKVNPYGLSAQYQEFLYWGEWFEGFRSTNVLKIRYDLTSEMLYVKFINHGAMYEYPGISVDLAYTFARTLSKGKWVWENLRNAFRAYRFVSSDDGHTPQRQMKLDIHGNAVGTGKFRFSKKAEKRVAKRMRRTLFHEAAQRAGS